MIYNSKHYNMEAIALENDKIILKALPQLGFKICSIVDKKSNFEFLFQPTKKEYKLPEYGADFSAYDTSGIDDATPSIDPCDYMNSGNILKDHGDVWSLAWNVKKIEDKNYKDGSIEGKVELPSLPLLLTRRISLDGNEIILDYKMENLSDDEIFYTWTFHGLNYYNEDTELEFPRNLQNYINVQNDEIWESHTKLSSFKDNWTFKYYFTDSIKEGWASIKYNKEGLKYTITFDPDKIPYLGVWLTTGGFKGEKNVAIEPSNGFYDTLERARKNKKIPCLKAKEVDTWTVKLKIEEI